MSEEVAPSLLAVPKENSGDVVTTETLAAEEGAGSGIGDVVEAPDDGEGREPAAIAEGEEPAAIVEGGEPAAIVEGGEPAAIVEGGEPAAPVEDGEPAAIAEGEEPAVPVEDGEPAVPAEDGAVEPANDVAVEPPPAEDEAVEPAEDGTVEPAQAEDAAVAEDGAVEPAQAEDAAVAEDGAVEPPPAEKDGAEAAPAEVGGAEAAPAADGAGSEGDADTVKADTEPPLDGTAPPSAGDAAATEGGAAASAEMTEEAAQEDLTATQEEVAPNSDEFFKQEVLERASNASLEAPQDRKDTITVNSEKQVGSYADMEAQRMNSKENTAKEGVVEDVEGQKGDENEGPQHRIFNTLASVEFDEGDATALEVERDRSDGEVERKENYDGGKENYDGGNADGPSAAPEVNVNSSAAPDTGDADGTTAQFGESERSNHLLGVDEEKKSEGLLSAIQEETASVAATPGPEVAETAPFAAAAVSAAEGVEGVDPVLAADHRDAAEKKELGDIPPTELTEDALAEAALRQALKDEAESGTIQTGNQGDTPSNTHARNTLALGSIDNEIMRQDSVVGTGNLVLTSDIETRPSVTPDTKPDFADVVADQVGHGAGAAGQTNDGNATPPETGDNADENYEAANDASENLASIKKKRAAEKAAAQQARFKVDLQGSTELETPNSTMSHQQMMNQETPAGGPMGGLGIHIEKLPEHRVNASVMNKDGAFIKRAGGDEHMEQMTPEDHGDHDSGILKGSNSKGDRIMLEEDQDAAPIVSKATLNESGSVLHTSNTNMSAKSSKTQKSNLSFAVGTGAAAEVASPKGIRETNFMVSSSPDKKLGQSADKRHGQSTTDRDQKPFKQIPRVSAPQDPKAVPKNFTEAVSGEHIGALKTQKELVDGGDYSKVGYTNKEYCNYTDRELRFLKEHPDQQLPPLAALIAEWSYLENRPNPTRTKQVTKAMPTPITKAMPVIPTLQTFIQLIQDMSKPLEKYEFVSNSSPLKQHIQAARESGVRLPNPAFSISAMDMPTTAESNTMERRGSDHAHFDEVDPSHDVEQHRSFRKTGYAPILPKNFAVHEGPGHPDHIQFQEREARGHDAKDHPKFRKTAAVGLGAPLPKLDHSMEHPAFSEEQVKGHENKAKFRKMATGPVKDLPPDESEDDVDESGHHHTHFDKAQQEGHDIEQHKQFRKTAATGLRAPWADDDEDEDDYDPRSKGDKHVGIDCDEHDKPRLKYQKTGKFDSRTILESGVDEYQIEAGIDSQIEGDPGEFAITREASELNKSQKSREAMAAQLLECDDPLSPDFVAAQEVKEREKEKTKAKKLKSQGVLMAPDSKLQEDFSYSNCIDGAPLQAQAAKPSTLATMGKTPANPNTVSGGAAPDGMSPQKQHHRMYAANGKPLMIERAYLNTDEWGNIIPTIGRDPDEPFSPSGRFNPYAYNDTFGNRMQNDNEAAYDITKEKKGKSGSGLKSKEKNSTGDATDGKGGDGKGGDKDKEKVEKYVVSVEFDVPSCGQSTSQQNITGSLCHALLDGASKAGSGRVNGNVPAEKKFPKALKPIKPKFVCDKQIDPVYTNISEDYTEEWRKMKAKVFREKPDSFDPDNDKSALISTALWKLLPYPEQRSYLAGFADAITAISKARVKIFEDLAHIDAVIKQRPNGDALDRLALSALLLQRQYLRGYAVDGVDYQFYLRTAGSKKGEKSRIAERKKLKFRTLKYGPGRPKPKNALETRFDEDKDGSDKSPGGQSDHSKSKQSDKDSGISDKDSDKSSQKTWKAASIAAGEDGHPDGYHGRDARGNIRKMQSKASRDDEDPWEDGAVHGSTTFHLPKLYKRKKPNVWKAEDDNKVKAKVSADIVRMKQKRAAQEIGYLSNDDIEILRAWHNGMARAQHPYEEPRRNMAESVKELQYQLRPDLRPHKHKRKTHPETKKKPGAHQPKTLFGGGNSEGGVYKTKNMKALEEYEPQLLEFTDYIFAQWGSPEKALRAFDVNGNAILSLPELLQATKKIKDIPRFDWRWLFARLDPQNTELWKPQNLKVLYTIRDLKNAVNLELAEGLIDKLRAEEETEFTTGFRDKMSKSRMSANNESIASMALSGFSNDGDDEPGDLAMSKPPRKSMPESKSVSGIKSKSMVGEDFDANNNSSLNKSQR